MEQIKIKSFLRKVLILLISFLCHALNAQNNVWIDTLSASPHQVVQFSVLVENDEQIIAFQSDIVFPPSLTYLVNSVHLTSRSNGHSLTASLIAPNILRVIVYSLNANVLNGNNGPIITFNGLSGTQPGDYPVGLQNVVVSNAAQQNILDNFYPGKFILLAPDIQLSNDSLDFGSIPLGQIMDLSLTISNNGNLPLSLISVSSNNGEMIMTDSTATTVSEYGSIVRTARFQPMVKGIKSGILTIRNNDPVDSVRYVKLKAHAYAVNEIHIGSGSARSGYQAAIRIRINNMEPFTAFQCKIPLPSVMKYIPGSAVLVGRNVDHTVSADIVSGNALQLLCFSPSNGIFQDSDGDIVELKFFVEGQGGNYGLPVTESIITDSTGTNILSAAYAGDLRIAAPYIQLTSSSEEIDPVSIYDTARTQITIYNTGDDTLLVTSATFVDPRYAVESPLPFVVLPGSDNDMMIRFHSGTRGTFPSQLTLIHNDVPRNPTKINFTTTAFIPNKLKIVSNCGSPDDTITIGVKLENAEPITALQFDMRLPSGAVFLPGSISATDRSQDHTISSSMLGDGAIRVLIFSLEQKTFSGSIGDVVRFRMKLPGAEGSSQIVLENVVVSNTANQNVVSQTGNAQIDNFIAAAQWKAVPTVGPASVSSFDSTNLVFIGDVTVSDDVLVSYFDREPRSGQLPPGVIGASNYFWKIVSQGVKFSNGKVKVPLSKIRGVVDSVTLVWLQRESSDDPWTNIGGTLSNGNLENVDPISSFSEFAIGTTSPVNPLPVEISSFYATQASGRITLCWTTATETNIHGFDVEKRGPIPFNPVSEEATWKTIGFVEGSGTTHSPHTYLYIDNNAQGTVCYRLKQIDRDGSSTYSYEIEVNVVTALPIFELSQNYPNPFNPSTTITFGIPTAATVSIKIYDIVGREVAHVLNGHRSAGYHSIVVNASRLTSGIYFYRITAGEYSSIKKMMLLR